MNLTRIDTELFDFGERYVPAVYAPKVLPQYLQIIRGLLFGQTPDRAMINYRLFQFMALLHSSELEEFMYVQDKRVTYLSANDRPMFDPANFQPIVTGSRGFDDVTIFGSPTAPDNNGRTLRQFKVYSTFTTVVWREIGTNVFVPVDRESDDHALSDTGFRFQVGRTFTQVSDVTIRIRPQLQLGQICLLLEDLGEPIYRQLFGLRPAEPYLTFKNLWESEETLPLRLGAVLLAMAYRTDEL